MATCTASCGATALAVLLGSLVATAQRQVARLPDGRQSVTVPLRADAGYVILPIAINGSEPLPILLDTGMPAAGIALFHGPHVDRLRLEYSPAKAQVGGAGGARRYEARISEGATFELGGAVIERSRLIVMPKLPYVQIGYAGVIGFGLLREFVVGVDYGEQTVTLTLPAAFEPPKGATRVALQLIGNMPHVAVRLPKQAAPAATLQLQLLLDLGAYHALSVSTAHPAIAIPEGAIERRVGRGLSGVLRGFVGRLPAVEFGGHRFDSVVASFDSSPTTHPGNRDGSLGIDVMRRFDFQFDYPRKALYLLPNEQFDEAFEADMSGLVLESKDGAELRVADVLPDSPAAAAGVRAGDVVVAIDGRRVTGQDRVLLGERLRTPGPLPLRYVRGDVEPAEVTLELRRLL